jgi:hypothetical protein
MKKMLCHFARKIIKPTIICGMLNEQTFVMLDSFVASSHNAIVLLMQATAAGCQSGLCAWRGLLTYLRMGGSCDLLPAAFGGDSSDL